ncbi:MAG: Maf family protein [Candidatus Fonsibacter sp.]
MKDLILASSSGIRKIILEKHNFNILVHAPNVDEEEIKKSLLQENATPKEISDTLARLKAVKVSEKYKDQIVLGADQVLSFEGRIFGKPKDKKVAKFILQQLSNREHELISSICLAKNGSSIWSYTESSFLKMKKFDDLYLDEYLNNISDDILQRYGVYQIEDEGRKLFSEIKGDDFSIMGMPVDALINYFKMNEKK